METASTYIMMAVQKKIQEMDEIILTVHYQETNLMHFEYSVTTCAKQVIKLNMKNHRPSGLLSKAFISVNSTVY